MNRTQATNRALPPLPLDLCLDLPPNIAFTHRRAISSPTSYSSSTTSGKKHFQNITRDLLLSSEQGSVSGILDPSDPLIFQLDPVKYDPSEKDKQEPDMLSECVPHCPPSNLGLALRSADNSQKSVISRHL